MCFLQKEICISCPPPYNSFCVYVCRACKEPWMWSVHLWQGQFCDRASLVLTPLSFGDGDFISNYFKTISIKRIKLQNLGVHIFVSTDLIFRSRKGTGNVSSYCMMWNFSALWPWPRTRALYTRAIDFNIFGGTVKFILNSFLAWNNYCTVHGPSQYNYSIFCILTHTALFLCLYCNILYFMAATVF